MREDERVTPLELFFDLVFVLAIDESLPEVGSLGR
jgi:low temperature requirement protein LtrA